MEIAGIDTVQPIRKNLPKEGIQPSHFEDRLTISVEAKKREEWVELVKSLPDIRPDKLTLSATDIVNAQLLTVAHKILDTGF